MASAKALFEARNYVDAAALLEQVYRQQKGQKNTAPASLALLSLLASCYEETGELDRALAVWRLRASVEEKNGLTRREETAVTRYGTGRCLLWTGKFAESCALLDVALLDSSSLGLSVRLDLALSHLFLSFFSSPSAPSHLSSASSLLSLCVSERASSPPSDLFLSLLLFFSVSLDAALLRRAYGLVALSTSAKDALAALVRKKLVFLALELSGAESEEKKKAAVKVAQLAEVLVEKGELRDTQLHAETLLASALANDSGGFLDRAEVFFGETLSLLERLQLTRSQLWGRTLFELATLLQKKNRHSESVARFRECVAFFASDKESDGYARCVAALAEASRRAGEKNSEMELEQIAISNSANFATLSRKTQQQYADMMGAAVLPMVGEKDEIADEREKNDFGSVLFRATSAKTDRAVSVPPTAESPRPAVSPRAVDRSKMQRRASVVDVFSPKLSPRQTSGTPGTPSGTSGGASPAPRLTPPMSRNSVAPTPPQRRDLPAPEVPEVPARDDSETMKVALKSLRKELPDFGNS